MLQELDEDMDQNMAHAKEGRRYREDMKARVDDRVYEMHDLSADKREGMREYGYAYRRGYALAMVFFSLALCVFAGCSISARRSFSVSPFSSSLPRSVSASSHAI